MALDWIGLDWVVQRLMKKEVNQRFQSARAVLQELRPLIQFVRQQYPTLLTALIRSPETTLTRLRADQGQAELHRVGTLLRAQTPQFIEACFAAWRAAILLEDTGVFTYTKDLAQRFRLFVPQPPTLAERPPALREDLWQNAAVHARLHVP
ncbi:MAG: hypothetical protein GY822_10250 [Deltaproteobacteria bacterium]|nr:hypothetical protein [Deltaproteobacteria bacterium]